MINKLSIFKLELLYFWAQVTKHTGKYLNLWYIYYGITFIIFFKILGIFHRWMRWGALACLLWSWIFFKKLHILCQNPKNIKKENVKFNKFVGFIAFLALLGLHWYDHDIKNLSSVVLHNWNKVYYFTCFGVI